MNVFKLGGASIKDAESIKRLPEIIAENGADRLVLVISALGKTTNKIETIVNKAYKNEDYSNEYNSLKDEHLDILHSLVGMTCDDELVKLFSEFDKKISVTSKADYDYFYDQTVSFGEMFSTLIVAKYLTLTGMDVYLAKANDIFLADKNWRSGNVDIVTSEKRMQQLVQNVRSRIIIIQGFISGTSSNDIVTLGREGSDYSAALVAVFCNATELTFWKDVDGIYSTDPKIYPDAQKLEQIGYDEMVELSYFGAKILHKKTLSVLKTKNIVARVRS
ncbi:MAG: aspartate kinase, partial [Bacteroidales bacterium]|nr:aspartate kinase [Bacteroidales bacterium]